MAEEKDGGIDLVKYGVLWQRVQDIDKKNGQDGAPA